jgi:CheY-like chemotaxis protein
MVTRPLANGHRVMVVGRLAFLRHVLGGMLREQGCDVAESPSVAQAAEMAPLHRPVMIFYIPVESTPEENAQLKEATGKAKVILVVPIQTSTESLRLTEQETGAVGSIGAPVLAADVAAAVEQHL